MSRLIIEDIPSDTSLQISHGGNWKPLENLEYSRGDTISIDVAKGDVIAISIKD